MDDEFFKLPGNVRKAITSAKMKNKHSDFYYKLKNLNQKINTYKDVFYNREPRYQKKFNEKQKEIEQKEEEKELEK